MPVDCDAVELNELFPNRMTLPEPGQPLDSKVLPGGGGVCALTDHEGRLVLTLAAENLRRALTLRLDPPAQSGGRPRADIRAVTRQLWWQRTDSAFETSLAYLRIARRLAPRTYRSDLAFGPVWFARVDPGEAYPRWVSDKFAFTPPVVDVGPFRDRQGCRRFIELLEDLFGLCRYYDVLRQSPHGQACAYKEMGKCPAPCDGTVSMDRYRCNVRASIEFATGSSDTVLSRLQEAMGRAAQGLQFERATRIREQIARARKVLAADGRIQPTPDRFRYLIIQRGGGRSRVKPFFIDRGRIDVGPAVRLVNVEGAAVQWADKMRRQDAVTRLADASERSECVWLVSHFLLKSDRVPGLFLHAAGPLDPKDVADRVRSRLGRSAPATTGAHGGVDGNERSQLQ